MNLQYYIYVLLKFQDIAHFYELIKINQGKKKTHQTRNATNTADKNALVFAPAVLFLNYAFATYCYVTMSTNKKLYNAHVCRVSERSASALSFLSREFRVHTAADYSTHNFETKNVVGWHLKPAWKYNLYKYIFFLWIIKRS